MSAAPVQLLAARCLQIRAGALPAEVEHEARRAVLDTLGCVLLGEAERVPALAAWEIRNAEDTAAKNACLAQVHDANDGHTVAAKNKALGHPGRTVVPVALAEAAALNLTWGDVIAAVVAGYEFGCRLRPQTQPVNLEALGAVAVLACLRGFSEEVFLRTVGIALPLSPQTLPLGWSARTDHNYLRCGASVRAAYAAAHFAEQGCAGPDPAAAAFREQLLEAENQHGENDFAILGRYTKPFPSCRMTHGAVECALRLRAREGFTLHEVERIEAEVVPGGGYVGDREVHESFKRRGFSLPVCVALALEQGELTVGTLKGNVSNTVKSLADRTEVSEDPAFTEWYPAKGRPSRLRVFLNNGTVLEERIDVPTGEPGNPESDEQLTARFVDTGVRSRPKNDLLQIAEWILNAPPEVPFRPFV